VVGWLRLNSQGVWATEWYSLSNNADATWNSQSVAAFVNSFDCLVGHFLTACVILHALGVGHSTQPGGGSEFYKWHLNVDG